MTVARHHVNLLYIIAGERYHYVLVKDLSRLVSSKYNNHKHKTYFCQYCLHDCTSEELLENHLERCKLHGALRIKLPEAGNKNGRDKDKFTTKEYQLRLFFAIYVDFQSILCKQDSYEPSSSKSFTTPYQNRATCGSCIYVKCSNGQYFEPSQVNMGNDAAEKFLDSVLAAPAI